VNIFHSSILFDPLFHLLFVSASAGVPVQAFVVGGSSVPKGKSPWQALLQLDEIFYCGGSIITPTCILTAAHCAEG
jgi:secreted trypsin-like serine protease